MVTLGVISAIENNVFLLSINSRVTLGVNGPEMWSVNIELPVQ